MGPLVLVRGEGVLSGQWVVDVRALRLLSSFPSQWIVGPRWLDENSPVAALCSRLHSVRIATGEIILIDLILFGDQYRLDDRFENELSFSLIVDAEISAVTVGIIFS